MKRHGLVSLLALLWSLPASGDDVIKDTRTLHLKSGTAIDVVVLGVDDTAVDVEFVGLSGSRGLVPRDAIAPSDVFHLLVERRTPKTALIWLDLAKEAETLGLHHDRIWSLRNAAKLDPERAPAIEKDIEACRQTCSRLRLGIATSYLEAGEFERAHRFLRTVLDEYKDCVAGTEATALLKTIDDNFEREKARATAIVAARRIVQDGYDDLQAAHDLMERGESALHAGRLSHERLSNAISRFNEAHALFERSWKLLVHFSPPSSPFGVHEDVTKEIGRLQAALRDDRVAVHLELGHAYLSRSSPARAMVHAGEAAALDPENTGVVALRLAIAVAR